MYYLAFFLHASSLLKQKLDCFIKINSLTAYFAHEGKDIPLKSSQDLPVFTTFEYPQSWFIHGRSLSQSSISFFPELPLLNGTSLEKIDSIMSWFSSHYTWSILPWGGAGQRFNSFVFIGNERTLRNSFVEAATNTMDVIDIAHIPQVNLFITSYDVPNKFQEIVQSIVFQENLRETGSQFWDACNCGTTALPWIVTTLFPQDEDDDEPPENWEQANYQLIDILEFTTLERRFPNVIDEQAHERLGVYEPQDKESFVLMLQTHWTDPDTLIVVPKNTKLDKLIKILRQSEAHSYYSSYSDLSLFQEFLELSDWFYGIDRDRNDYTYSLFISKNSALIRDINDLVQDNNYRAISFF